ncbi:MAG: hypothetical protein AAFR81_05700 [Chloroflexota bacterium]
MKPKKKTSFLSQWWQPQQQYEFAVDGTIEDTIEKIRAMHDPKWQGRRRKFVTITQATNSPSTFEVRSGRIYVVGELQSLDDKVLVRGVADIDNPYRYGMIFLGAILVCVMGIGLTQTPALIITCGLAWILAFVVPAALFYNQRDHRESLLNDLLIALEIQNEKKEHDTHTML